MLNKSLLDRVIKNISQNCGDREVVTYGYNQELHAEINSLAEEGKTIQKIFTGNRELLARNDINCHPYAEMNGLRDKYYVIIPFLLPDGGIAQRNTMEKFGYEEYKDYCFYPFQKKTLKGVTSYSDDAGNVIECGAANVSVFLNGTNNYVKIPNFKGNGKLSVFARGNNNRVEIGEDCTFNGGDNIIDIVENCSNARVLIGDKIRATNIRVQSFISSATEIGERCTCGVGTLLYNHPYGKITIGKDCMFSFNIVVQTGDGHSIFDINTGENINNSYKYKDEDGFTSKIEIGEHCWISREAMMISGKKGTEIGKGSIIGARALVKGKFPNNCILAGIPAKIIRKNVAWARNPFSDDIGNCGEYCDPTIEDE